MISEMSLELVVTIFVFTFLQCCYATTTAAPPTALGDACSNDLQCSTAVTFSVCSEGTCQCDSVNNYVEVYSEGIQPRKRSVLEVDISLGRKKRALAFYYCAKDCGIPASPTGYNVVLPNKTYTGSTADYVCESGYAGTGDIITCQTDGTWTTPIGCSVDCSTPSPPTGYYLGTIAGTTEGSTVEINCDPFAGYTGSGGTITCESSGNWSPFLGCSGLHAPCSDDSDCSPHIANSVCTDSTCQCDAVNSYVEPSGGYGGGIGEEGMPLKKRSVASNNDQVHRMKRGEYMDTAIGSCVKDCGTPIPDAGYTLGAITTTYDGSSVFYSCASGYLGSGGMTVCEADGTWVEFSGCEANCDAPVAHAGYILGTVDSTTEGSTVEVTCDTSANYSGDGGNITCERSRSWSAFTGCAAVCGQPNDEDGYVLTSVTSTTEDSTAEYVCDTSNRYCGDGGTIKCQSNHQWTAFSGCTEDMFCNSAISVKESAISVALFITFVKRLLIL